MLNYFEHYSGVPRSYAVLVVGLVYIALVFLNIAGTGEFLSNIVGFVVPGYYSLIALSTKGTNDDAQLLTYWVIFAFLNVIEFWSGAILYWIPFYFLFKTFFLVYIGVPSLGGSVWMYNAIVGPLSHSFLGLKTNRISSDIKAASSGISSAVEL